MLLLSDCARFGKQKIAPLPEGVKLKGFLRDYQGLARQKLVVNLSIFGMLFWQKNDRNQPFNRI